MDSKGLRRKVYILVNGEFAGVEKIVEVAIILGLLAILLPEPEIGVVILGKMRCPVQNFTACVSG